MDGWRWQHDALKWQITQDCNTVQARVLTEIYGLFAAHIPQAGRRRLSAETARKRQGLVPDFMLYADIDGPHRGLKTLHYGSSTYPSDERRCNAASKRARAIPAEYAAKTTRVDTVYCGTPDGEVGPVPGG